MSESDALTFPTSNARRSRPGSPLSTDLERDCDCSRVPALELPGARSVLSNDDRGEHGDDTHEHEITPDLVRVAAVAGLGGLLFGFDTGVVSGALLSLSRDPHPLAPLSTGQESFLVSSALVAAFAASLCAGTLADLDRVGRKGVVIAASVLFSVGAAEMALAEVYKEVILGRVLVGFAVGLASCVLPTYLAELSPPKYRGTIVASLVVLITLGQVLAYVVDWAFASTESGWRWMFGSGVVPALSQLVLSFSLPESPRFLVQTGRTARGRQVVKRLNPKWSPERVHEEVERLMNEVGATAQTSGGREPERVPASLDGGDQARGTNWTSRWIERVKTVAKIDWRAQLEGTRRVKASYQSLLWHDRANRRTLIVACGLQFFQQSTGFNCLMYYSTRVIEQTRLSSPATFALVVAISNFVCTVVALRLIDRTGRRKLLLRGLVGMIFGMVVLSISFAFIARATRDDRDEPAQGPGVAAVFSLLGMTVFCCAYALSLGNVPWVVQSEVFRPDLKSLGTSLATAANWGSNIAISSTFLPISQAIGPSGAFGLLAIICTIAWIFTYALLPETKGISLDQVRDLFEGDFVVVSRRRRRTRNCGTTRRRGRDDEDEDDEEAGLEHEAALGGSRGRGQGYSVLENGGDDDVTTESDEERDEGG